MKKKIKRRKNSLPDKQEIFKNLLNSFMGMKVVVYHHLDNSNVSIFINGILKYFDGDDDYHVINDNSQAIFNLKDVKDIKDRRFTNFKDIAIFI